MRWLTVLSALWTITTSDQSSGTRAPHTTLSTRGFRNVNITEAPYIVFIIAKRQNGYYNCTGFFIHKIWILTAASCIDHSQSIRVEYGDRKTVLEHLTFIIHSMFKTGSEYNIALIKVRSPDEIIEEPSYDLKLNYKIWPRDAEDRTVRRRCFFIGIDSRNSKDRSVHAINYTVVYEQTVECLTFNKLKFYKTPADCKQHRPYDSDIGGPIVCQGNALGLLSEFRTCGNARKMNKNHIDHSSNVVLEFVYIKEYLSWINQFVRLNLPKESHLSSSTCCQISLTLTVIVILIQLN